MDRRGLRGPVLGGHVLRDLRGQIDDRRQHRHERKPDQQIAQLPHLKIPFRLSRLFPAGVKRTRHLDPTPDLPTSDFRAESPIIHSDRMTDEPGHRSVALHPRFQQHGTTIKLRLRVL